MQDHQILRDLLTLLREHGVTKYQKGDLSLELGHLPLQFTPVPTPPASPTEDEEAMFWSADQ